MAFVKEQKFTKTPFKKQSDVLTGLLKTNPILNDDEKASINETVGILTWLNQVQLHWKKTGTTDTIPSDIANHIFEGRKPMSPVDQQVT